MNSKSPKQKPEIEEMQLSKAAEVLVDECRMILPGIQTLFGFQLIAIFNSTFTEKLTPFEQRLHLLALALIGISIVIIMTPAAYHRQIGPRHVSEGFIHLATHLLISSMPLLALSISVEVYLVSHIILHNVLISLLITLVLLIAFIILWFVLPYSRTLKRFLGDKN
jgi:hypothetical protein